jgi:methionyl-tRNA formyltransferase
MKVLYVTNKNVADPDLIPAFIRSLGDTTMTCTSRFDLQYVIDHGIEFIVTDRAQFLITRDIIDHLPKRIVNLHPSYLPWGRGYHPNYWSIVEGFPHGVTLHFIDEGIDSGEILAQTRCHYGGEDTLRDTYDRLRRLMVDLFKSCWPELRRCAMTGYPQDVNAGCLHYRKDFDGRLEQLPQGWDTRIKDVLG